MNARLRKVARNRGQFPSEQAALKVLYPAVRNFHLRPTPWQAAFCAVSNRRMHPGHPLWFLCAWGT
jgi:hypothetical protein